MAFSKQVIIGSVGISLLLLGAGAVFRGGFSPPKSERSAPRADSAAALEARAAPALAGDAGSALRSAWRVGESRSYSLDFSSRLEADAADPQAWFAVVGSAVVKLVRIRTPDAVVAGTVYLQGQLSGLSVVLENEQNAGLDIEAQIAKDLDAPFLLRVAEDGRIQALGTRAGLVGTGYNILRSSVAALQFVEPSGTSPSYQEWETLETDQNGICRARYRARGGGGYVKTKLGYTYAAATNLAATPTAPQPSIQSTTDLVWQEGRVVKAEMSEAMAQPFGEQKVFKTKMHIALALVGTGSEPIRELDTRDIGFLQLFESKLQLAASSQQLKQKRELVAGASLADLRAALAKLADTPDNREARWTIKQRTTALLELDPTQLGAAIDSLKTMGASNDRELLLASISDTNTPEVRKALGELALDRSNDAGLRDSVLTHLGVTQEGRAENLAVLQEVASDPTDTAVHATAMLAFGSAADAASKTSGFEAAAEEAVQKLGDGYKSATTPQEQRLYLDALGNAAQPAALDTLRLALKNPDVSVRLAAVSALQSIPGVEAEQLLTATLLGDAEPNVRAAAVKALERSQLSERVYVALEQALRLDQVPLVRFEIIGLLSRLPPSTPAAQTLLRWASLNDPEPDLRQLADEALKKA